MEHVNIKVTLMELERPRKVDTNYGVTHTLVEGKVEDKSGSMGITVWNDKIDLLERLSIKDHIELKNCFITSFKGELSINVGRDSDIIKREKSSC